MALALDTPLPPTVMKTAVKASQPVGMVVPLKDHQLAMLQRCADIEKSALMSPYKMGFMADSVSAGKTSVAIAMVLADKSSFHRTSLNVVIVPQNICMQWRDEITKFTGKALKVLVLIDYSSIAELTFNPAGLAVYDIVLTTPAYFVTLADFCERSRINPRRVIIDEADTVANMIGRKIPGTMTWFVSATMDRLPESKAGMVQVGRQVEGVEDFNTLADETSSLKTRAGATLRAVETGTYEIPARLLRSGERICRCDAEWVKESFGIPSPIKQKIICSNVIFDVLASLTYSKLLQPKQLESANARDFRNLRIGSDDEFAVLPSLLKWYNDRIEDARGSLTGLESTMHMEQRTQDSRREMERCQSYVKLIRTRAAEALLCQGTFEQLGQPARNSPPVDRCHMCEDCTAGYSLPWFEKHGEQACLRCGSQKPKVERMCGEPAKTDNKVKKLAQLILDLQQKHEEKPRVMVFAKYTQAFSQLRTELASTSLVIKEADAGTAAAAEKMLNDFKSGSIDVLLAESSLFCSGMNLPEVTDVCFLHVVHAYSDKQISGRAQRPGRKAACRIWTFLHDNEAQ